VFNYKADKKNVPESPTPEDQGPESALRSSSAEFILCIGDDFTDEDMFRALNGLSSPSHSDGSADSDPDHVFTVTVGANTKVTLARWHLLEAEDVIESVALLAGVGGGGARGDLLSMGRR
jgi:trehalose 6-phosphate synthase/phosphatase